MKDPEKIKRVKIEVNATIKELHDDWNVGADKFGLIAPKNKIAPKKKKNK